MQMSSENPVCVNASEIGMHFLKGAYDTAWGMHPKGYESKEGYWVDEFNKLRQSICMSPCLCCG